MSNQKYKMSRAKHTSIFRDIKMFKVWIYVQDGSSWMLQVTMEISSESCFILQMSQDFCGHGLRHIDVEKSIHKNMNWHVNIVD